MRMLRSRMHGSSCAVAALSALAFLVPPASADLITRAPNFRPVLARQESDDVGLCAAFNSIAASCSAATPGFADLAFTIAATCLCYSSSTWQPSTYDNALVTCLAYLSTARPAFYSSISRLGLPSDPCQAVGDVATITRPGGWVDANNIACVSWYSIESSCSSDDVTASRPPFSIQASCLCYTSSVFAPTVYDGYWGSCLDYYQTASPEFYSSTLAAQGDLNSPCARVGDVRDLGTVTSTSAGPGNTKTASSSATTAQSTVSGPVATAVSGRATGGSTINAGLVVGFGILALLVMY